MTSPFGPRRGWARWNAWGPAQVRREAGVGLEEVQTPEVGRGEQRGDGDALRGLPGRLLHAAAGGLLQPLGPVVGRGGRRGAAQVDAAEVGDRTHAGTPSCSWTR